MKTFWLSAAMALTMVSPTAMAFQETKAEDAVAKERSEKRKRLQEINKVQDDGQKKELLEKFVQETTDPLVLATAYDSLLKTLTNIDPNKTIELADQILAKPLGPRDSLRTEAYIHKFRAYQKQKNEYAIKTLGLRILETENNPALLHVAADFYKDGAVKFYEKAKNQGFSMVAINTIDFQNDLIPEWKAQKKFTLPILVGATDAFLKETYNHQGNPTNMLVNADGKVLFRHVGYDAGGEKVIEAEIREMLGLEPFEAAPVETGQEEKAPKQN